MADATLLVSSLKNVGYHRFSAYLHPFCIKKSNGKIDDNYDPGTTQDKVWSHYLFDRKLRFLMMDAKTLYICLTSLRVRHNDCAHHARIRNKTFLTVPRMNNTPALLWDYVYSDKARKWVKLTASLAGAPSSQWHVRMLQFLHDSQQQGIPLHKMGLPEHWEQHSMWK